MKIGLRVLREIEINDDVYRLDIDTAGEEVGAHKVTANALAEVVEDSVSVRLKHLRVGVET